MTRDLFSSREDEIFKTLKELKECDFVIIGGYAVNTYALPRFSIDCDIVIRDEDELRRIEKFLLEIGYTRERTPQEASYSGSFHRYVKRLGKNVEVSIDILVRQVSDRMTGAVFSADWIFKNSRLRILRGRTIREELKLRIINRDPLIVMKMLACRSTDIRDVFMMLPGAADEDWIRSEISSRYDLEDRLSKIIEKVDSHQFKDGLSGVYGKFDQQTFDRHKKAVLALQKK